jgi:Fe2+ or Zn2+ uptake regulation protein
MSDSDTRRKIMSTVEQAAEPALSAKQIADRMEVSVKTVHNHISQLVESDTLETTQIGNATAYYSERITEHPADVNQQCSRCGRSVRRVQDMAKVDIETYFEDSISASTNTFRLFCRFCYEDWDDWVFGHHNEIGNYPLVHSWDIPAEQLRDVQEDPDVLTTPDVGVYDDRALELYNIIDDWESETGERGMPVEEIYDRFCAEGKLSRKKARSHLNTLKSRGWLQPMGYAYATPLDASRDTIHPSKPDA